MGNICLLFQIPWNVAVMQPMLRLPWRQHWQWQSPAAPVLVETPSACSTMGTQERSEESMAGWNSSVSLNVPTIFTVQGGLLSLYLCVLSGRSARAQTLDFMEGRGYTAKAPPSPFDALNITVPGAPACWCDTVQLFGSQKVWPFFFFKCWQKRWYPCIAQIDSSRQRFKKHVSEK